MAGKADEPHFSTEQRIDMALSDIIEKGGLTTSEIRGGRKSTDRREKGSLGRGLRPGGGNVRPSRGRARGRLSAATARGVNRKMSRGRGFAASANNSGWAVTSVSPMGKPSMRRGDGLGMRISPARFQTPRQQGLALRQSRMSEGGRARGRGRPRDSDIGTAISPGRTRTISRVSQRGMVTRSKAAFHPGERFSVTFPNRGRSGVKGKTATTSTTVVTKQRAMAANARAKAVARLRQAPKPSGSGSARLVTRASREAASSVRKARIRRRVLRPVEDIEEEDNDGFVDIEGEEFDDEEEEYELVNTPSRPATLNERWGGRKVARLGVQTFDGLQRPVRRRIVHH